MHVLPASGPVFCLRLFKFVYKELGKSRFSGYDYLVSISRRNYYAEKRNFAVSHFDAPDLLWR